MEQTLLSIVMGVALGLMGGLLLIHAKCQVRGFLSEAVEGQERSRHVLEKSEVGDRYFRLLKEIVRAETVLAGFAILGAIVLFLWAAL